MLDDHDAKQQKLMLIKTAPPSSLGSPMLKEGNTRAPCCCLCCKCCDCKLTVCQFLFLLLLGIVFALVCIDMLTTQYIINWTEDLTFWMEEQNVFTVFVVFCCLCICFTLFCIPATVLALAAGYLFTVDMSTWAGILMGTFTVEVGCVTGASITFFISRYILYDCAQDWISHHQWLQGVDLVLKEKGFKMNFLLRLSPLIPFNVCNYLLPTTNTSFMDYLTGCIGMIPWFMVCVYFGSFITEASALDTQYDTWSPGEIIVYVIGGIVFVISMIIIIIWTRKVINKELNYASGEEKNEEEKEAQAV